MATGTVNEKGRGKNGFVRTKKVACPEMCCYCFDVLISYIQNNGYTSSSMKNHFSNDE